ncbi:CPBP family intramembrane glutamic endopeptidase [Aliikangiella sp. G2MR2-5]|uniref:CPBP family intramembrane glutamic endopeptidase n=1 Tax=Aliikangiella sp. G2MR2-5 TaxID=2788943 RepID=UPI0018AADE1F|nr:type II CAAX endopeptidase family protein [Aliikangiella sp. G2MR2-5]
MLNQRLESPWNFSQGLLVLVTFIVLYIALTAAHMLWVKSTVGFEVYLKSDTDFYTKVLMSGQIFKGLAILAAIWFMALKRHRLNWTSLGFVSTTKKWLAIALLVACLGFVLRLLLMKWLAVEIPGWTRFMQPPLKDLSLSGITLALFLLLTVILTPIVEEIFFRGFLFRWMANRRPVWLAAVISSAMFGASHIVPPQAISAALMSFLIIYLYVKSGSIWPAIFCHIVNNAISFCGNLLASADMLPSFLSPPVTI